MMHVSPPLKNAIQDYINARGQLRAGLINSYTVSVYRERVREVYKLQKLFCTPATK